MPYVRTGMQIYIIGDHRGVQATLHLMDTALNPVAIAGFLGAEVGPYLQKRGVARFASEGDDVSGKWAPLSEATQSIREKGREAGFWDVGDAHPINVRTHEMETYVTQGSIQPAPTAYGARLSYPANRPNTELREKLRTAAFGRTEPPTPRRPVLGVNEQDLVFVLKALAFHIQKFGKARP